MQLHLQRAGSYLRLNDLVRWTSEKFATAAWRPLAGRSVAAIDPQTNKEAPVGRWNKAALVCVGDWSVHAIGQRRPGLSPGAVAAPTRRTSRSRAAASASSR